VWRAEGEEPTAGEYRRLTEALIRPDQAREHVYAYVDTEVEAEVTYAYRIEAVDRSGGTEFFGPVRGTALVRPFQFFLAQNVPNPFNPSTELRFELPAAGRVQLSIYDIEGRLVRRLVDGVLEAGPHAERWDGRDQAGRDVASGIYFSRLSTNEQVQHRKMMLIR
jgi:hypothetical protein